MQKYSNTAKVLLALKDGPKTLDELKAIVGKKAAHAVSELIREHFATIKKYGKSKNPNYELFSIGNRISIVNGKIYWRYKPKSDDLAITHKFPFGEIVEYYRRESGDVEVVQANELDEMIGEQKDSKKSIFQRIREWFLKY